MSKKKQSSENKPPPPPPPGFPNAFPSGFYVSSNGEAHDAMAAAAARLEVCGGGPWRGDPIHNDATAAVTQPAALKGCKAHLETLDPTTPLGFSAATPPKTTPPPPPPPPPLRQRGEASAVDGFRGGRLHPATLAATANKVNARPRRGLVEQKVEAEWSAAQSEEHRPDAVHVQLDHVPSPRRGRGQRNAVARGKVGARGRHRRTRRRRVPTRVLGPRLEGSLEDVVVVAVAVLAIVVVFVVFFFSSSSSSLAFVASVASSRVLSRLVLRIVVVVLLVVVAALRLLLDRRLARSSLLSLPQ